MKKIVFNVRDEQYELVLELVKRKNFFNVSEALRFCIVDTTERHLNNYKEIAKLKMKNKPTPKDKALAEMEAEDERRRLKEERVYSEKREICVALNGTEQEQNGFPVCVFKKYTELPGNRGLEETLTTIPFENLTEEQIQLQYQDMVGLTGLDVKKRLINKYK